eukprot:2997490-Rhodomonas_salina.1
MQLLDLDLTRFTPRVRVRADGFAMSELEFMICSAMPDADVSVGLRAGCGGHSCVKLALTQLHSILAELEHANKAPLVRVPPAQRAKLGTDMAA